MLKSITIDFANQVVSVDNEKSADTVPLSSAQAFSILSAAWLRCGWDVKYVYSFSWLGRPVIQLPEDLLRMQELIYRVKPDVIVETGIAHGGSLIFYASLCQSMGKGRIVGVDVEIRPHNRKAIEDHELFPLITLIEGDSVSPDILHQVESKIKPGDKVLVILDSCHTKEHVLAELNAYSRFVSIGSYMVAMDGIMQQVAGAPHTKADWSWNNPRQAALEFVQTNKDFVIEKPGFVFNEGSVDDWITYSPDGILLRVKA
jgi:cephalosporin hydroxylase